MRILLTLAVLALALPARAELIASESFLCDANRLEGRGGGTGWTGPWRSDPGAARIFMLEDNELHIRGQDSRIFRRLDLGASSAAAKAGLVESAKTYLGTQEDALGKPGTTVWLGFNAKGYASAGGPGAELLAQVHLYHGVDTTKLGQGNANKDGEAIAIGRGNMNTDWNYESTCSHTVCGKGGKTGDFIAKGAPFNDDKKHWVVLRFQFEADITKITFWLDPPAGAADPSDESAAALSQKGETQKTWGVSSFHFDWVEIGGGSQAIADFDEVRLATTFADLSDGASTVACALIDVPHEPMPAPPPKVDASNGSFHVRRRYIAAVGALVLAGVAYFFWRRKKS